jgi:anti-sigma factor RsiW
MKPCSYNRQQLAWLAAGALDETESRKLRAHVENCAACRDYLTEMKNVTRRLASPKLTPEIQTSESFHQSVMRSVRSEKSDSMWMFWTDGIRSWRSLWRVPMPVAIIIVLLTVIGWNASRHPQTQVAIVTPPIAQAITTTGAENDPPPTFSNYRMAANRSSESFDELLARQARKNLPSAPIYTASTLDGGDGAN